MVVFMVKNGKINDKASNRLKYTFAEKMIDTSYSLAQLNQVGSASMSAQLAREVAARLTARADQADLRLARKAGQVS